MKTQDVFYDDKTMGIWDGQLIKWNKTIKADKIHAELVQNFKENKHLNSGLPVTHEELDNIYNTILMGSKMKRNDPIMYIDLDKGKLGVSRLTSGQLKILYTAAGSDEVKWTWLSKGQLKKVFGK